MTKITTEFKLQRLEKAKQYAISRGGECLSTEYINVDHKMEFKCANKEHDAWFSSFDKAILEKRWCSQCSSQFKKNYFLNKAREHAISHEGICLSNEYKTAKTKMMWKCHNNLHQSFESDCDHLINRNRWCPECLKASYHIEGSEEEIKAYAKSKNGSVINIDSKIIHTNTDIVFKCHDNEHKPWKVNYRNAIQKNTWCPECAGRFTPEENIQKAKEYAISRGGNYVSGEYKNQDSRLTFKCGNLNHKPWTTAFDKIIPLKTWCQECRIEDNQFKTLARAKQHAISKGGKCLSTFYKAKEKLLWKCEKNHNSWYATYQNVVDSLQRWCPECAGFFSPEDRIKKAQEHALSKHGNCLSHKYVDSNSKLIWQCSVISHNSWEATYANVVHQNTWCPDCKDSINIKENYTRIILEELLGFKLRQQRPKWNRNPKTNRPLELDGYNEKHKFAFEFQGKQHYQDNLFFQNSLSDIKYRDQIKKENCKNKGIYLLVIDSVDKIRTPKNMLEYIVRILELNFINYDKEYSQEKLLGKIKELYKIPDGFRKNFKKKASG